MVNLGTLSIRLAAHVKDLTKQCASDDAQAVSSRFKPFQAVSSHLKRSLGIGGSGRPCTSHLWFQGVVPVSPDVPSICVSNPEASSSCEHV